MERHWLFCIAAWYVPDVIELPPARRRTSPTGQLLGRIPTISLVSDVAAPHIVANRLSDILYGDTPLWRS